ncbi:hypothetical protein [Haloarcula salinisoli]|uniref:Uncharacterized protein n=1 Tax=Haloarcula salinisoli TaxID=2487746 RepID=A0A8J7YNM5_9EURY|nr:hypothetical protein [Halomicroarcula salinisoli]MBX0306064.1 hypothetical protein [Halomicroarcula salinisoli]
MATADTPAGDGGPKCARDFVEEKLQEADSPMAPAELAEEYGCTNGHVRNLLSDLRDEGEVERVAHGQYAAVSDEEAGDAAEGLADLQADSAGNAQEETEATEPEETAQETPEPTGGQAPSEDRDTEDSELPETAESMGVPLPVSANAVLVGAALFLVLALWWRSRSSGSSGSSSSPSTSTTEETEEDEEDIPLFD